MRKLSTLVIILLFCLPLMGQVVRNRTIIFDDLNDPTQVTGYHIYYGQTQGGPYPSKIDLPQGTLTATVQLAKGTWYFVCTAYNPDSESGYSNEASTVVYDNAQKVINLRIVVSP